ncbi:pyruvate dehydrogenase (acetyl-transferring) E1 component, alpha subunit [Spirochaeta thermophila DSM 6578]|uniref:Pyruvate dehydrogenase E1 component subunit alpha n=1 Tax=Winmispira thermophila (strain ATCC 700085 / DSM 6578 / Z-1203) TaxID=869211 RepID=G0GED1_WINT7|nr:pyruvate dehydrogenase (acetyl-transferring) E1 component subunit alpha [Spirochaeta thermophila]AEJ62268.1 pyruvate dehydrogenase (acetyl-transferring) E1 component, alpha subunit [Spirochaeta thermophila DSM 6578]
MGVKRPGTQKGGKEKQRRDLYMKFLREMLLIRVFEEKSAQMYGLRKIGGFCHLYIGQEAVAVGSIAAIDLAKDYVVTAYRDHGHALACGMDPKVVMAELFGKVTGCSRGKGGSMHMFDVEKHFLGGNGIVGAQIPVGTGVAFAQKYEGTGGVTLVYFGDGAIHQGAFHEALNLAKIWELPVVYICENNQWGMGTFWKKVSAVADLYKLGAAYDIPGVQVDGMDVRAVYEATTEAVSRAREGDPVLIEARTYRYKGHSMSDPAKYRTREELEEYKRQDPIGRLKTFMEEEGLLEEKTFRALYEEIQKEVDEAVEFAERSEEPALHTIYEDVYAGEDATWRS